LPGIASKTLGLIFYFFLLLFFYFFNIQEWLSTHLSGVYQRPFCPAYSETDKHNWQNHPNFSWKNDDPFVNESQGFHSHYPYVPPHQNTLEDTLQAFLQGQSQINQNIMQNIQESKNSLNRIVSYLDESEQEFFPVESLPNPRTQCGENEVNSSSG